MKDYLAALITEQKNRSLSLKALIPYPEMPPILSAVANKCTIILDEQLETLSAIRSELEYRGRNDGLRDIFRQLRICVRTISDVEYYGIPALYFQTKEVAFLNSMLLQVHRETKLPFVNPAVCCATTQYYFSVPVTNTIFVPLGESQSLLHLPDLYHELGHYALINMSRDLRLKPINEAYEKFVRRIDDHYISLLKSKNRDESPKNVVHSIELIWKRWKDWLDEFFCDLFALYSVGPAYAWSHLHLTIKTSKDIHASRDLLIRTHPSDASRMQVLLSGLKLLGFDVESEKIFSRWQTITKFWAKPSTVYQYAFPRAILEELAQTALDAMGGSNLSVASSANVSILVPGHEMKFLFNEAWDEFWEKEPDGFRRWEEETIKQLKQDMLRR